MNMEVEAFIFGKKIGTILLKDGYSDCGKVFPIPTMVQASVLVC